MELSGHNSNQLIKPHTNTHHIKTNNKVNNNNQTPKTPWMGVQQFKTEAVGSALDTVVSRLPLWLLGIALFLRFNFLTAIIPELALVFSEGAEKVPLSAWTFVSLSYIIPITLEVVFTVSSLANPSLWNHPISRKWAYFLLIFAGIGLVYNAVELYLFVSDFSGDNMKAHFLLQLANIASLVMAETAGFMIIQRGTVAHKEKEKEEEIQSMERQQHQRMLEESYKPTFFQIVDAQTMMYRFEDETPGEDQVLQYKKLLSRVASTKSRWKAEEDEYRKEELFTKFKRYDTLKNMFEEGLKNIQPPTKNGGANGQNGGHWLEF